MANASLAPLRHRQFALTLSSSFISSTGTWMQQVTLGIFVYHRTHSAIWLGAITAAGWLPAVVASPLGGVISDRWNRQHWIQLNNFVMALCASTLAACAFTHHLSPMIIFVLALVEGFSSAGSWAAWQSLLPDLVDRSEVLAAVSLSSAQFNLGRVIGPAIAAVVLSVGTYGWCFAINAGTFVYVMVVFFFVRTPHRVTRTTPVRFISEIKEGARAAWANPACRNAIISIVVIAFVLSPFITLIPAMSIRVLHGNRSTTAWLIAAQGVGAVLSAFILPTIAHRTSRLRVLRGALVALVLSLLAYSFAPSKWWALGALVVVGGAYMGTLNGLNASVQLHAPVAERSRILSLYTTGLQVGYPVGAVLQGVIAQVWGIREISITAALIGATVLLVVSVWQRDFLRTMGVTPQHELVATTAQ